MRLAHTLSRPETPSERKIRMGVDWQFEPATNYYIKRLKMKWVAPTSRGGPDGPYDYYYTRDAEMLKKHDLEVVKYFPASRAYVAVPRPGKTEQSRGASFPHAKRGHATYRPHGLQTSGGLHRCAKEA